MIQLTVAQLARAVGGRPVNVDPQLLITGGVVTDSRLAGPGAVFVAVRGERTDGHEHAEAAAAAGAALVVAERPVEAPHVLVEDSVVALGELAREVLARLRAEGSLRVVGLTGSVGKTTTKDVLAQVLAQAGPTVAPRESFNNEIGLPLTVLSATRETRYLVLEMGASGPGHIDYLTRIAPLDVAVVLVVGHAHMGGFGTIDAVARAKAEIVAGLRAGGTAVLNADDARVAAMAPAAPGTVTYFGRGEDADVRATDVTLDEEARPSFMLHTDASGVRARHDVHLALHGEHQVSNALAVAGAALALGLDAGAVAEALGSAQRVSAHRMAVTHRPDGVVVVDDAYNANPDSMGAALRAVAAMPARRRIAVVGEMLELGEEAERAHEDVGRLAAELGIDVLVAPGPTGEQVRRGAAGGPHTHCPADVDAAAALLGELLQEGDLVLLKGSNGSGVWRLAERLTESGGAAW
ncbi:UDP-N-acetylmuramoyl-tripeptide--D-alanyl-D-alanine ligase [Georgenia sp. H159]|uniref:UDP-N-acetylmuramoyl-tripeptide--D-alanyl-D- alanine ligase n=1 Tax=Georgenia sp. H159 TaxID=3076115 RepID=UPI002D79C6D7|nr:UDP-N-acetylmuramoyl-tripeptide--D-alanyl-D-alanine ligase [Georgenia sp. H159]